MDVPVAFRSASKLYFIGVAGAAGAGVQILPNPAALPKESLQAYLVTNLGAVPAFFNLEPTDTPAVIPTAGNPQSVHCILPGAAATFTGVPGAFISAICASSTSTLMVEAGQGL